MDKDVSLKGGISATVYTDKEVNLAQLESQLKAQFNDVGIRQLTEFGTDKQIGILVEIATEDEEGVKDILEQEIGITLTDDNYSIEVVGSALGESFYRQMIRAMIAAFILIGIVVLITYRALIPSIAVMLSPVFDIIVALAFTNLFGIKVSTAGISAFLLLIGYSIDSDILLTTKALKRHDHDVEERIFRSIKTGLTMTATTIVALTVGYVFSVSPVFKEMFSILIFGLLGDVIVTYCLNSPIVLLYAKRKGVH